MDSSVEWLIRVGAVLEYPAWPNLPKTALFGSTQSLAQDLLDFWSWQYAVHSSVHLPGRLDSAVHFRFRISMNARHVPWTSRCLDEAYHSLTHNLQLLGLCSINSHSNLLDKGELYNASRITRIGQHGLLRISFAEKPFQLQWRLPIVQGRVSPCCHSKLYS